MNVKIAVAGQPNSGKSTIFNMLSGIRQHVANYPGVTVDKKSGYFSYKELDIELVDLPGTYSFSSYSLEEKVAKKAVLEENPDIIMNIIDASNLKRNLYLTFQLLEIGTPAIVVLNMIDVAENRGIIIDKDELSKMLGCPVIFASGKKKIGKDEILEAIYNIANKKYEYEEFGINYEELEESIESLESKITSDFSVSKRWFSIKALEGDSVVFEFLNDEKFKNDVEKERAKFKENHSKNIESFLAAFRYDSAELVTAKCLKETKKGALTLTEKIDKIVLNRWFSFPILFLIIVAIYELAIVQGYAITNYTWPLLASIKNFVVDIAPSPDIINTSLISDFAVWIVNSMNALLNYLPIFFILFALIAILEDVGYMPRMAFILDRVFKKFGLHGQSTLPLVLGGAFVGGCAVPGLMSTKGIADDRARLATIFTVPLMNCLSKVPFYTLLLGAFFLTQIGIMMFYISTVTIFTAMILAKILTSTVLKTRETAPFIMELPAYHVPTIRGVFGRALERVWVYIKKVVTVVLAVAVILFALLQFPGLGKEDKAKFDSQESIALQAFDKSIKESIYYESFDERVEVSKLLNAYDTYRAKKMAGAKGVDEKFEAEDKLIFTILRPQGNKDATTINRALRKLSNERNRILREQKNIKIEKSLLGRAGKALEPVTQYAGFDWKINVAFLASFAARESAVATVGSIYETGKSQRPEEMVREGSGYTPLHAVAIIIFMLLSPPCIAAMVVVKLQSNSWKFMLLAMLSPFILGMIVSATVFSLGVFFGASGFVAMSVYYFTTVGVALLLGFLPEKRRNWQGGLSKK